MGYFIDKLKAHHEDVLPSDDLDDIGLDIQIKQPIPTKSALAAVALDQAVFDVAPGQVVALFADRTAQKHLYRFLRDIAYPNSCSADGADRCADGDILIQQGKIETSKWGSHDWWDVAYQRGLGVVIICGSSDEIGDAYAQFVDRTYDLRGPFDASAYDVVSLVLGIDRKSIPDSVLLEMADWAILYSSVRPSASVPQVLDRIGKLCAVKVGDWLANTRVIPESNEKPQVRLRDLSGYGDAKTWGMQLAADLMDYRCGRLEWCDLDHGLLLTGDPGVGKSYYAKALAAECGVELIVLCYQDWAGDASGKGDSVAGTLNKHFKAWREKAKDSPIIVFVDEIDSVGKRGGNAHNESWFAAQINAWLAFLDGSEPRDGIVVIAATNLPDRVDPAMLRPGRLERTVNIPLPTIDDLPAVIKHHLPDNADMSGIDIAARACRGRSPADVAMACREARRAARRSGRTVTALDVRDAVDSSRNRMSASDDRRAAIHEAGHAVVAVICGRGVDYVDLDACQTMTGFGKFPGEEEMTAHVLIGFAGRASEQTIIGSMCIGSAEDIKNATDLVRKMLTQFGYGASMAYVDDNDFRLRAHLVQAVEARVDDLYQRTVAIVRDARPIIEKVAARLIRDRYMTGAEVRRAMTYTSIMHRRVPKQVWPAPSDNERGNPANRSKISWSAAA